MSNSIFLPAGYVLSFDVSADVEGTYCRQHSGGEPYSPVAFSADIDLGPFAETRSYQWETTVGSAIASVAPADPEIFERAVTAEATAAALAALSALHLSGAGVPVDYTDGSPPATGEGVAPKGALYSDTDGGLVYRNSGTMAEPIWQALADVV